MKRTPLRRKTAMKRSSRPMAKVNRKRKAKRHAAQFGPQAQWCREQPCWVCNRPPPSDPHHVVSRGAGGTDEHTVPLCRTCHTLTHARHGGKRLNGADLVASARDIARRQPWGRDGGS